VLETPDPNCQDEWDCLTRLAARSAPQNAGRTGVLTSDGKSRLR
jgi:hypothetical protein